MKSRLRSDLQPLKENCFLCANECLESDVYFKRVQRSKVEGHERTLMVDSSVKRAVIERRQDAWAKQVNSRIASCTAAVTYLQQGLCIITCAWSDLPPRRLKSRERSPAVVLLMQQLWMLSTTCATIWKQVVTINSTH